MHDTSLVLVSYWIREAKCYFLVANQKYYFKQKKDTYRWKSYDLAFPKQGTLLKHASIWATPELVNFNDCTSCLPGIHSSVTRPVATSLSPTTRSGSSSPLHAVLPIPGPLFPKGKGYLVGHTQPTQGGEAQKHQWISRDILFHVLK